MVSIDSGTGLANATSRQRLVPIRLFYGFLMEEGLRESSPAGRGRYTPGRQRGGQQRGLVPRLTKLPWIPSEQQWLVILQVARAEPARSRVMPAPAYDAALRREELCSLRTDDLDPAHRTLRVRAETTKNRPERVVPYSASTGVLMSAYLAHRAGISRARGPLFLSEPRRNHGQPLTLWTWSKLVRRIALEAGVPRFSTHTTRHLCLTDLARMGWELHAIATFAGHRTTDSTLQTSTCPAGTWPTSWPAVWSTSMPGAYRFSRPRAVRRRTCRGAHATAGCRGRCRTLVLADLPTPRQHRAGGAICRGQGRGRPGHTRSAATAVPRPVRAGLARDHAATLRAGQQHRADQRLGYSAAGRLFDLPDRTTALATFNDKAAVGALRDAHERGCASRRTCRSPAWATST
ncbi:tyrosine-type recombinase/integrase [Kitasatospora sp. NPDC059327]|uniref:tyrosine-type recombinase/integrase n=1 Tax=Kitasatospora sp. NPDC059327 TaxID=3346803 RepID=UPI00369F0794